MGATVVLPQVLRSDCDGAPCVEVEPPVPSGGATLRDVLDELTRLHPRVDRRIRDERGQLRRYVNVFVGDEECRGMAGLDTPVPDGEEVRVLPSVAGG
ncbi:molybdopterin synthase subunit MoaD [Haloactinospora alba]|uniref:Molybdopterin synthase subunit MoaD n=1 Tax=Haloactinospora alba TaxID=405555 RepID=A0A543NNJ1_9ACTN|nr:MoaD/ThiS family protein [Haloactinospora alba]TQN33392.1 molybdopterin synthase subunit MoaD [Haloactinospora alba]